MSFYWTNQQRVSILLLLPLSSKCFLAWQKQAKTGKNVIATIHQPPSHALELVDNVLLIGKGGVVVYFGSPNNMLKFFSSQGLNCPPKMSLADFVIDQTSLDGRSKERQAETTTRLQELVSAFKNYKKETPSRKLENIEMPELSSVLLPNASLLNEDNEFEEFEELQVSQSSTLNACVVILLRNWKAFLHKPDIWLTTTNFYNCKTLDFIFWED